MKLFIDTTQNYCNLALINHKNQIVDKYQELTNNNMTDWVIEKINGPGSFTGCRVGYIIAVTWANIKNIKLYIMNSLLFQTNKGTGISIIDAKSNKKFIAIYDKYQAIIEPEIILKNQAEDICKKHKKINIYSDYKNIDFFERLQQHLSKFKIIKNLDKLEPLYLKRPIE